MRASLVALALASLSAAGPTAPRPIRLDVIATDARGQVVRNLTAADFEVREDDKSQQVTSFDVEEIATTPQPAAWRTR